MYKINTLTIDYTSKLTFCRAVWYEIYMYILQGWNDIMR